MNRSLSTLARTAGALSALVVLGALWALPAHALQIVSLTPQGEVARVRQIVAKFDQPAVKFGDPKAPAPLVVNCTDAAAAKGTGRWTGEKQWVYDFENDLPPGVRCTVARVAEFKSGTGTDLTGPARYQFNSGGPFVRHVEPSYGKIDEQQLFALELSGPATLASVRQNIWCAVDGVGERVPVRLIEGANRTALLKSFGQDNAAEKEPLRFVTLQCNRTLTPASRVQIVYGKGVATPSGIANAIEKRFSFEVREPFAVSFTCERENAQAACLPLRPMELRFNAPVSRKQAMQITMKGGDKTLQPKVDEENAAADDAVVESVTFAPPFAEQTPFTIALPPKFVDASGRAMLAPDSFPMKTATGPMPPLAKFAASPFGVVERFAEPGGVAIMPVTVRRVEPALRVNALTPGKVSDMNPQTDAEIIAWYRKVKFYDDRYTVDRKLARSDVKGAFPKVIDKEEQDSVQTRMLSLLGGQAGVKTLDMPKTEGDDPRPFEVIGIPLTPGFHVLEIASQKLGDSLLDERYGSGRTMYVRTTALATNLAVHFKLGRENSLAWVTTLDKGQVVANAKVRVSDCRGKEVATGNTDASGVVTLKDISPDAPRCNGTGNDDTDYGTSAYFVSARAADDLAFTWSDWQRGIEPYRFNVPTSQQAEPDRVAHTLFDRTLLRAGETVSMKHLMRTQTSAGFGVTDDLPDTLVITHVGSGQKYQQPIPWRKTATDGRSAENIFSIPPAAKLGLYTVTLKDDQATGRDSNGANDGDSRTMSTGSFRVEEFRLPVLEGRIMPTDKKPLVNPTTVPTEVQINYVAGGGAANLPVRVSALVRGKTLSFGDYDSFSFAPPQKQDSSAAGADEEADASQDARVIADKLAVTLDKNGAGKVTVDRMPKNIAPRELLLEATYSDPNGEVQTIRSTQTLWPAAVIAGVKTESWISVGQKLKFQALALDLSGKPQADVALDVKAIARITTSSRKRMVGGFYTYDNKTETKDLGTVCSGKSDSRGSLLCDASLSEPGRVELIVSAQDKDGNTSVAASSVYVTKQGEIWFGGEDNDRIDVLPEKKSYQPGEVAKFQVRMPFRFATALVSVEREGIIETHVVQLNGQDPTVSLVVKPEWGPNAYVSVLALRGRLREVPWYSFFTWGFKAPREWWTAFWYEGKEYVAPTALVDLSKPAYRLGLAEIRVGTRAHQIDVKVASDKPSYPVRGTAQVTITGRLPDGKPAAGAEVALAAVDQALLELMPNDSWNLLEAMLQRRSWGVSTSTAQMEIVGRRHYGRKAVPAGGGGGKGAARELLDTLLLWNPHVVLDANGQAVVTVPLNDALTTFRIVAVADQGAGLFGTGQTTIQATQDLQIISGLPPLVREDDQFRAQITLRNTTQKPMKVEAAARATMLTLQSQTIDIPAGESREVAWMVTAPAQLAQTRAEAILWEIEAKDITSGSTADTGARDALKVRQRIISAVPLTVQQATLVQLDGPFTLDVAMPADGLPGRGGLKLSLQPKLAEGLPGVRDYFANYPFICLEQKTSKSIGLRDAKLWQGLAAQIPSYLDSDGLANYFPPRDGEANRGSDILTSYLLAVTQQAAALNPAFALPDDVATPMQAGLIAFVEGRIQRDFWSPRKDLDVRKLAALEALSRYGKAHGRMTTSLTIAPNQWPTSAVIDWMNILKRVADVPQRQQRLDEANNVLKARLSFQGTKLVFGTEQDDYWWWLMTNGDVNTARLLLSVMDDPAWKDDIGKLAEGFIGRQQNGAWHTTTANLWGGLALEEFSKTFESTPVTGITAATLGNVKAQVDWSKVERVTATDAAGAPNQKTFFGAPAAPGNLRNNSMFLPWPAATPATAGMAAVPAASDTLHVTQQGSGKPWLTLQSIAAVPLKAPFAAGYQIKKTITPVEQATPGIYTRGDILRISLEVNASADMTWVVISDPTPGGATILGGGLGRDSQIATQGEKKSGAGWAAFEERSLEAFRSYYEYLPKGVVKMEYTVRLNSVGDFALPPSRVASRRGDVCAGDVWGSSECAGEGGGGEVNELPGAHRLRSTDRCTKTSGPLKDQRP